MLEFLSPPPPLVAENLRGTVPSSKQIQHCSPSLSDFAPRMLRDLPGYANRVILRRRSSRSDQRYLPTVIVASQAEYQPLPVVAEKSKVDPNVRQLFFTTLERQRVGPRLRALQQYHWLLLTPTSAGWRIVLSYTRTGAYPQANWSITPPRESSQQPIAQAVNLWLRDCHAGAIRPTKTCDLTCRNR